MKTKRGNMNERVPGSLPTFYLKNSIEFNWIIKKENQTQEKIKGKKQENFPITELIILIGLCTSVTSVVTL